MYRRVQSIMPTHPRIHILLDYMTFSSALAWHGQRVYTATDERRGSGEIGAPEVDGDEQKSRTPLPHPPRRQVETMRRDQRTEMRFIPSFLSGKIRALSLSLFQRRVYIFNSHLSFFFFFHSVLLETKNWSLSSFARLFSLSLYPVLIIPY